MSYFESDLWTNATGGIPTNWTYTLDPKDSEFGTTGEITSEFGWVTINSKDSLGNNQRADTITSDTAGSALWTNAYGRFRFNNVVGDPDEAPYATLNLRMPGTNTNDGHGYYVSAYYHWNSGGPPSRVQLHAKYNPGEVQGRLTNGTAAKDVTIDQSVWYWFRLQLEDGANDLFIRAKFWSGLFVDEPEDWTLDSWIGHGNTLYSADPGLVGVGNGVSFNKSSFRDIIAWDAEGPEDPTRVRSNVSATVGSLLEATDAPALESGVREDFFEDEDDLPAGELQRFIEATATTRIRTKYYPNPASSQERLAEYVGSTKLGRMADAYPEPIQARAVDLVGTDTMTAQELITALFERWHGEFPWFTFSPVPDLRYRVEGDDYTGNRGELTVEAVLYPQDEDEGRRLSMRQILDEILSIFPGTGIVQNMLGDIALRPTYGPDAPSSPSVTLANEDAFSVSTGDRPDPRRVYNRARVTSRGYEFQEDQAVITDSYLLVTDANETPLADSISSYEPLDGFAATIPYSGLVDTSGDIDVTYTAEVYSMDSADGTDPFLEGSETATLTFSPGANEVIVTVEGKVGEAPGFFPGYTVRSEWGIRRRAGGINVRWISGPKTVGGIWGTWYVGHVLKVGATGNAFVQRNESVTGRFGYDTTEDELIDSDGNNVLEASQTRYGEREISISTEAFALTPTQAQEIAQGLVLHHITPRVVRTVEQSWSSAYKVEPDHIGRIAQLPSGADAIVEERTYTDDYTSPLAPLLASTFKATLTEPVANDPTETNPDVFDDSNLLAFDSGAWLRFDDGTLVEQT